MKNPVIRPALVIFVIDEWISILTIILNVNYY